MVNPHRLCQIADHHSTLAALAAKLQKERRKLIRMEVTWVDGFPQAPGVYAVFEKRVLVYVGETKDTHKRMKDLQRRQSHTLHSHVGTAKLRTFKIAALPVYLGRKELEEHVIRTLKPIYNRPMRRGASEP